MALRWTASARGDLLRLHGFLEPVNPLAAARVVQRLIDRIEKIPERPRLGSRLPEFDPREVRRVVHGDYEIRYELRDTDIFVLRIFHGHEER